MYVGGNCSGYHEYSWFKGLASYTCRLAKAFWWCKTNKWVAITCSFAHFLYCPLISEVSGTVRFLSRPDLTLSLNRVQFNSSLSADKCPILTISSRGQKLWHILMNRSKALFLQAMTRAGFPSSTGRPELFFIERKSRSNCMPMYDFPVPDGPCNMCA